jgi:hypothetical protein
MYRGVNSIGIGRRRAIVDIRLLNITHTHRSPKHSIRKPKRGPVSHQDQQIYRLEASIEDARIRQIERSGTQRAEAAIHSRINHSAIPKIPSSIPRIRRRVPALKAKDTIENLRSGSHLLPQHIIGILIITTRVLLVERS